MTRLDPIRSALFQILRPIFVTLEKTGPAFSCDPGDGPVRFDAYAPALPLPALGDRTFICRHRLKYPYVAGAWPTASLRWIWLKPWRKTV